MAARGVVFVHGSNAPGNVVSAFMTNAFLSLEQLSFACASQAGQQQFTTALAIASPEAQFTSQTLAALLPALAPGAALYVYAQGDAEEQLRKKLLLGGFLDIQTSNVAGVPMLQARKPSWEVGAKAPLSLRRAVQAAPAPVPAVSAQAWKLSSNDDEDMIDEDELLGEDEKRAAPAPVDKSDCSTSKKACKNCSCGRAEAEAAGEKVQLTQEMLDNPQTNCGSCALGDAFRCAGCPYRGLPAFEPGKKITLGSDFLTADA